MKKSALILLVSLLSANAFCLDLPDARQIVVSGSGYVDRMPDYVEVTLTVAKTSDSLAISKREVDSVTEKLIVAVSSKGIAERDIRASRIQAQKQYEWNSGERHYLGHQVTRTVTLLIRDLDSYSDLIQLIIENEVTTLDGISLEFNDRGQFERQAMEMAIRDAQLKAEGIARQFGQKIATVHRISEIPFEDHTYYKAYAQAMDVTLASPEQSGKLRIREQRVRQNIYAVFMLK